MARCEAHGLAYDSATTDGCVVCKRERATKRPSLPAPTAACAACGGALERGVDVCPRCGSVSTSAADTRTPSWRWLVLIPLVALPWGVYAALMGSDTAAPPPTSDASCVGATVTKLERLDPDGLAPKMDGLAFCSEIDPAVFPHIVVGRVYFSGDATYAHQSDTEVSHMHEAGYWDKCHPLRPLSANAFFQQPSRQLPDGRFEIVTTAAVAHPGRVSTQHRDAYFPADRACMIVYIYPGSQAEQQGLSRRDLVALVDGRPLSSADPQAEFLSRTRALPMGASLKVEVIRDGKLQTVALERKQPGVFGYNAITAPLIEVY